MNLLRQDVPVKGGLTLLHTNQPDGFDCPAAPGRTASTPRPSRFCENGAKAVAFEATSRRVGPEFFAKHSVEELARYSDYWLEDQGRLTHPMRYNPATGHYEPVAWDGRSPSSRRSSTDWPRRTRRSSHTSGRTSNRAAFLYQLFVRQFGTNNFRTAPTCATSRPGWRLIEQIGIGKGTVTLHDFNRPT